MREKVLITGASGFVGHHLVQELCGRGYRVFAAVRDPARAAHLPQEGVTLLTPDLSDRSALDACLRTYGFDYIVHAAGVTKTAIPALYDRVNAGFTENLAVVAARYPLKRFVLISSLAAVGPLPYHMTCGLSEDADPGPVTSYGKSKLQAEVLLRKQQDLPWVIIRPTAVYGPREKDLLIMFRSFSRGWEPYIGRAPQKLSFVYVADLARLVADALQAGPDQEIYHVSDGQVYDRYALAAAARLVLGKRTLRLHVPVRMVRWAAACLEAVRKDPALNREKIAELAAGNWDCRIDHAVANLGYRPAYDLDAGVRETLDWYRRNNWL